MKLLRLLPLLLLPALFLGATCVTHVDQKGPAGPWVGEVTNTGTDAVDGTTGTGFTIDANGKDVGPAPTLLCPWDLLPGDKAYFSISAMAAGRLNDPSLAATLPLRLSEIQTYPLRQRPVTGLTFRVLQAYPEHQAIMVEMRNDSPNTYSNFDTCAVLLSAAGEVQEIVTRRPSPAGTLSPGQSVTFPFQFSSPLDGTFVFGTHDGYNSTLNTVLPSTAFDLETYKIVETPNGRELLGVGEITNTTTTDLMSARYEVYLTTSPTVRANGNVGPYGADFRSGLNFWDGNGLILAGKKAPFRFSLPLDQNDTPSVEVAAIEAGVSEWQEPPNYVSIPVTNVETEQAGTDSLKISATISNPTDDYMLFGSLCFNLRGSRDKLVGTSCLMIPQGVEARSSLTVSEVVAELAPMHSVEVIAYGFKGRPVTPPT